MKKIKRIKNKACSWKMEVDNFLKKMTDGSQIRKSFS